MASMPPLGTIPSPILALGYLECHTLHMTCVPSPQDLTSHTCSVYNKARHANCRVSSLPVTTLAQGTYDLAAIYTPQLESLESILQDSNLSHYDKLVEPLPKRLTQEMLNAFDSRKEQIRVSLEEAILSR